ncbi:TolC family protein [Acidocella aromatica]|nr:TolC family protein [Acidocella aromatica]
MVLLALAGLSSCAAYHPAPLLDTAQVAVPLPTAQPLTLAQLVALAMKRDPDLVAARAQAGIAQAELLAAGTPPDPSLSIGFEALLGGPASMSAIAGSLGEDVSLLVTRSADVNAAKAHLLQVNANILWQEWQVAARAAQLGVTLTGEAADLASLHSDDQALTALEQDVQVQTAAGNLTQQDVSATQTALAVLRIALNSEERSQARDEAQLDALLALPSGTPVALTPPDVAQIPPERQQQALATLPRRRPDLLALRYGYTEADEKLRAVIRSQFLPISLGAQGGRDTSGVVSAGPQVALSLPLFNRNRPAIQTAEATRAALRAQYAASLADARNGAEALEQSISLLQRQATQADQAAAQAASIAEDARHTFAAGGLDARMETDLITAAGDREREVIQLHTQLQTANLSLAVLLGLD